MTATLPRPAPPTDHPAPETPTPARSVGHDRNRRRAERLVALAPELALALVTASLIAGFDRIFLPGPWVAPLLWAGLGAHLVAAAARRLHIGAVAGTIGAALVGIQVAAVAFASDTLRRGLPTLDTFDALADAVDRAVVLWPDVRAPLEPEPGFVLITLVAVVVGAVLADDLAFRRFAPVTALAPTLVTFVVVSLVGDGARVRATVLLVAAALTFVLLHRVATDARRTWLPGDAARGPAGLVGVGAGLAALAVLAGALVAPALPGAGDDPLWTWRGRGDGPRITISPLVDIQSRLVQQSSQVAFRVESDQRSYWRLTALDTFDGRIWRSSGSFSDARGDLPGAGSDAAERVEATQRFEVLGLSAIWAPVAFEPRTVDPGGDAQLSYDERSGTLIVDEVDTTDGLDYEVTSLLPRFVPDELRAADGEVPSDIAERQLQLPDDLSPVVAGLAAEVTAGTTTDYDAALALQQWFRSEFTYSLDVAPGHDGSVIERFLTETRQGYCEQFAGSFAAMARTLGIPARVAVGFTPGDAQVLDDGTTRYTVRGEHAHAWPEVFIAGAGWVPFEPTPSRGAPGAEQWTGVAEQQEGEVAPTTPTTTAAPVDPADAELNIPEIDFGAFDDGGGGSLPDLDSDTEPTATIGDRLWWIVAGVPVLVGSVLAATAAIRLARRSARRRSAGSDPTRRTLAAWADAVDEIATLEVTPRRAETDLEFARRAAVELGDERAALVELATITTAARHRAGGVSSADADAARAAAERTERAVRDIAPRRRRLLRWIDPRPALPRLRAPSLRPRRLIARRA